MAFLRDWPLVFAVLDAIPVEAFVDRAERAELVEDVLRAMPMVELGVAHALGDFRNDPPSAANRWAAAHPIPLVAPVINAVLSIISILFIKFYYIVWVLVKV